MPFTLRPYQEAMVVGIRDAIRQGKRRILCVCPTGGGKGVIAAEIMDMAQQKDSRGIFFADQRELIDQIAVHLTDQEIPYDVLMAGVKNEYQSGHDFGRAEYCRLIAKDTLWARRKKIEFPPAKVVQVDEAHKSLAKTWTTMIEHYKDSIVLGWTATPCRTDGRPLGEFYDCLVIGPSYKELQADKHLVPVRCFAPDRPDLKGLKTVRGDYAKGKLEDRMNRTEMVGSILNEWKANAEGRSTIAFAAGIQHSLHIRDVFRRENIHAEHLDGTLAQSEREDIIGRFRAGDFLVLCNYGVLTTGIDIPRAKYMICARPTKSFGLWRQMGGRFQRPFPGHDHCFIQDHSDNGINFGYPDEDVEWQIEGKERIEDLHRKKKEDGERPEAAERQCGDCARKFTGRVCPECGWRWEPAPEEIKMTKGELKELERKRLNKTATLRDKQTHWDNCFGMGIEKGFGMRRVCALYCNKFGVYPSHEIKDVPKGKHEWALSATQFYFEVVKPERQARELREQRIMF